MNHSVKQQNNNHRTQTSLHFSTYKKLSQIIHSQSLLLSSDDESSPIKLTGGADDDSGSGVFSFTTAASALPPLGPDAAAANASGFSKICLTVSSPSQEYVLSSNPNESASLYADNSVCGTFTIVG